MGVRSGRIPGAQGGAPFPRAGDQRPEPARPADRRVGGGRLLWRRAAAVGMEALMGVDSGPAAPASAGSFGACHSPPDLPARANSHCTKFSLTSISVPRRRKPGSLGNGHARDAPATASQSLWKQNSWVYLAAVPRVDTGQRGLPWLGPGAASLAHGCTLLVSPTRLTTLCGLSTK